jgi:hypothetical protein
MMHELAVAIASFISPIPHIPPLIPRLIRLYIFISLIIGSFAFVILSIAS